MDQEKKRKKDAQKKVGFSVLLKLTKVLDRPTKCQNLISLSLFRLFFGAYFGVWGVFLSSRGSCCSQLGGGQTCNN